MALLRTRKYYLSRLSLSMKTILVDLHTLPLVLVWFNFQILFCRKKYTQLDSDCPLHFTFSCFIWFFCHLQYIRFETNSKLLKDLGERPTVVFKVVVWLGHCLFEPKLCMAVLLPSSIFGISYWRCSLSWWQRDNIWPWWCFLDFRSFTDWREILMA